MTWLRSYRQYWINAMPTDPFFRVLQTGYLPEMPEPTKELWARHKKMYLDREIPKEQRKPLMAGIPSSVLLEALLSFGGGGYRSNGYRSSTAVRDGKNFRERVRKAMELISATDVTVTSLDYKEVLAQLGEGDICYLDPPYRGYDMKAYSDKTIDHEEMVQLLLNAKFRWVLSEYENEVYKPLGEPALRVPVRNSMGNREKRVECIWTNFPTPASFSQAKNFSEITHWCRLGSE